ncbi:hypothetical protein D1007_23751 [Hordeum vulgare]|nr:hypothetical protein D1007_23751 [Hordeum vulgare]
MTAQGEITRAEILNIDELENLMGMKLTYYRLIYKDHDQRRKLCILFQVPKYIKQVDKLSYEPKVLSIGPYYHGNASLQFMEKVKWNCLDYVLKLNCRKKLEVYLTAMESLEKQARSCYSEEVSLGSDMFLRMILLDGCFILVYLSGTDGLDWCLNEHNVVPQPEEIMEHASHKGTRSTESMRLLAGTTPSLCSAEVVELDHISTSKQCYDQKDPDQLKCDTISEWHHSHVFRDLLLLENQLPFSIVKRIHGLLVGEDYPDLLTDKICKYLELNIQKYTTVARKFDGQKEFDQLLQLCHMNLVAFEQTCSQFGNDVTAYIAFVSQLVSTPCDVALLARKGIILHHMRTDEEVATLFSKLGKNVDFDQNGSAQVEDIELNTPVHNKDNDAHPAIQSHLLVPPF